jgi:hypothetical protein
LIKLDISRVVFRKVVFSRKFISSVGRECKDYDHQQHSDEPSGAKLI